MLSGADDGIRTRDPHLGKSRQGVRVPYKEGGRRRKRCKHRVLLLLSLWNSKRSLNSAKLSAAWMIGMTALVMGVMRILPSLAAASPPVEAHRESERTFRLAQHQRRPKRRQEQPQAVTQGREEPSAPSTAALLMEGAEGGVIWGVGDGPLGSWRLATPRQSDP